MYEHRFGAGPPRLLQLVHCNCRSSCNQHRRVHSTATEHKKYSPHPYSCANAKIHKTMTRLRKTASDVKDKAALQISRTTANLLGKKAHMIIMIWQSTPCDNWYFLKGNVMKIIIQWKKRRTNSCVDQRKKFVPTTFR